MKHPFTFDLIYSSRKTLAVQVTDDGTVKVRAPLRYPVTAIHNFLTEKEDWILRHIDNAKSNMPAQEQQLSAKERKHYIQIARAIFEQKTKYYAAMLHVSYGRISIREQKTRWGSCSGSGNLNYNWRLIFAPEEVLNYVVVHELAHRLEMNHSAAFYSIVEDILPEYKCAQKWLREKGRSLWTVNL